MEGRVQVGREGWMVGYRRTGGWREGWRVGIG